MFRFLRMLLSIPREATGKREIAFLMAALAYGSAVYALPGLDGDQQVDLLVWMLGFGVLAVFGAFGFEAVLKSPILGSLIERKSDPLPAG